MRKSVFTAVLTLIVSIAFAQESNQAVVNNASEVLTRAFNVNQSSFGSTAVFVNPPRQVEGSIYMFPDWDNTAIIQSKDKKRIAVSNVNFNLRRNRIVAKYSKDSIFVFDMMSLDKLIINGQSFKKIETETDSRIFEVIFELENIDLLKWHHLKIVEGSANPMVNRKVDKFKHTENYVLYKDNELIQFKLKKKGVLKLLAKDNDTKKKIIDYYKTNKLSFKKPEHFKKLLTSGIL